MNIASSPGSTDDVLAGAVTDQESIVALTQQLVQIPSQAGIDPYEPILSYLTMHVADNEVSSSALAMLPRHVQGDPASGYVRTEIAEAARLDDLDLVGTDDVLHVKVDVQGYEKRVLDGAKRTLERAALVELELSLVRLYEGGPLCAEISSTWPSVASSPFGWTRPSSTRRPVGCYRRAESSPGGPDAVTAFSHEAAHRRTYRS
jgi:FkbM family methyltransferase